MAMTETMAEQPLEQMDGWWLGKSRWDQMRLHMVPSKLQVFTKDFMWGLPGRDALDLGCEGGAMAEELARRGANVTGIDSSLPALSYARQHAAENGLLITYDHSNDPVLPYADNSFDVVTCMDLLPYMADQNHVLAEAARVLRPGGSLCYDMINKGLLTKFLYRNLAEDFFEAVPKGSLDSSLFRSPSQMRRLLQNVGLDHQNTTGFGPRSVGMHFETSFGPGPFGMVYYLGVARKL